MGTALPDFLKWPCDNVFVLHRTAKTTVKWVTLDNKIDNNTENLINIEATLETNVRLL